MSTGTPTPEAPAVPEVPAVVQVLVVPTELFVMIGSFQGISVEVDKYLDVIFDPANTSYRPRPEMEKDPTYKQLIPYVVFRCKQEGTTPLIFVYTRTKKQGEERLHTKRSIGVGGHIEVQDSSKGLPYEMALVRELAEEIWVGVEHQVQAPAALINDETNDVGKVHLGVLHFADVPNVITPLGEPSIKPNDPEEMVECGFHDFQWLKDHLEEFENWSQIAINNLLNVDYVSTPEKPL